MTENENRENMNKKERVYLVGVGTCGVDHDISMKDFVDQLSRHLRETSGDKMAELLAKISRDPGISNKSYSMPLENSKTLGGYEERNRLSLLLSFELAVKAVESCMARTNVTCEEITHIISCTSTSSGAPGLDEHIKSYFAMNGNVKRYTIQNMGCAGGAASLDLARSLCAEDPENNKVLVVCVDVASPHSFKQKYEDMNDVLAELLFSDGAGALLLSGNRDDSGMEALKEGIAVRYSESYTIPDTLGDTNIHIDNNSLRTKLSRNVDSIVSKNFLRITGGITDHSHRTVYLAHPGGKSILNALERDHGIDLSHSKEVLNKHGNMSSPSIIYVLEQYLLERNCQKGTEERAEDIYLCCFGQGIYMSSVLLSAVNS